MPVIDVERLTKRYPAATAVDEISFSVQKGEIVGFLGPNGAGKTTTLRMLTGFLPPTSGTVRVDGYDVERDSMAVRRRIGYLPENVPLYEEMRVREYLTFRATLKEVSRARRAQYVDEAMQQTKIADVQHRIVRQLSKGYRQRVGLADALVAKPPILVLDEPTVGLDPNQIRETRELIKGLGKSHTILLSTHILPEVEAICGRVVIINRGKIVGQGTPDELRARRSGESRVHVEARGEAGPVAAAVRAVGGVKAVDVVPSAAGASTGIVRLRATVEAGRDVAEDIFRAAVAGNFVLRELRAEGVRLEEIFAQLTTDEPAVPAAPAAAGPSVRTEPAA